MADQPYKSLATAAIDAQIVTIQSDVTTLQTAVTTKPTFPIGTIIASPTAPTQNGTWLACDGTSVSQSTYATLFSSIGHGYMRFTPTVGTTVGITPTTAVIWTGTKWTMANGSTTAVYSSVGSGSWNSVSVTTTTALSAYATRSYVIAYTTATGASISTDGGVTYGAHTLPVAPTNVGRIAPGNVTTNYLLVNDSSRSVYTMADGGVVWTTTANALPATATSMTVSSVWWDGASWWILDGNNSLLYTTVDDDGITNWTTVGTQYVTHGGLKTGFNGATVVVHAKDSVYVTTNSSTPLTQYPCLPTTIAGVLGGVLWNGFCWVAVIAAAATGFNVYTSKDGQLWANSGGLGAAGSTGGSFNRGTAGNTNSSADPVTGKIVSYFGVFPVLLAPTPTVATQFSLPTIAGRYIRAL